MTPQLCLLHTFCAPCATTCHPTPFPCLRCPEPAVAETLFSPPLSAIPEVVLPVSQTDLFSVTSKWAALQNCLAQNICPFGLQSSLSYFSVSRTLCTEGLHAAWVKTRSLVPGRTAQVSVSCHTLRDTDLSWFCLHGPQPLQTGTVFSLALQTV